MPPPHSPRRRRDFPERFWFPSLVEKNQKRRVRERRERKVKRARATGKGFNSPLSLIRSRVSMGVPVRDSKSSFKSKLLIFVFVLFFKNKSEKRKVRKTEKKKPEKREKARQTWRTVKLKQFGKIVVCHFHIIGIPALLVGELSQLIAREKNNRCIALIMI